MKFPSIKMILVDGVSNVGKTTFIDAIKEECAKNRVCAHYIHPTKNIIDSPYLTHLTKTREVTEKASGLLKALAAFETNQVTGLPDESKEQTVQMIRLGLLNYYVDTMKQSFEEVLHVATKNDDYKHVIILDRSFLTGLVYNNISPSDLFLRSEDGYIWQLRLRSVSEMIESRSWFTIHSVLVTGPVRTESDEGKEAFDAYYDEESRIKKEKYESWYQVYQSRFFQFTRNHYSMVFENDRSLEELNENARALVNF